MALRPSPICGLTNITPTARPLHYSPLSSLGCDSLWRERDFVHVHLSALRAMCDEQQVSDARGMDELVHDTLHSNSMRSSCSHFIDADGEVQGKRTLTAHDHTAGNKRMEFGPSAMRPPSLHLPAFQSNKLPHSGKWLLPWLEWIRMRLGCQCSWTLRLSKEDTKNFLVTATTLTGCGSLASASSTVSTVTRLPMNSAEPNYLLPLFLQ